MAVSDGLRVILKGHLDWGKCRLDCFIGMLLALVRLKHVNLTQLALAFTSQADPKSRYRRLQRFFREVVFDYDAIASLIMEMFGLYDQSYYLTLDRTNWKWGEKNLNILTLGIVYQGTAIPVYWLVLNKQGNSNQRERIALLQRYIRQFGRSNILGVLGDREFIGDQWWQWLSDQRIPYLIRMKDNQLMTDQRGYERPVRSLFANLQAGKTRLLRKKRRVGQQWVWLSGMKLNSGELLVLAGNQRFDQPLDVYGLRWEIETLFQCLKGRGFHLEETRITHYFRIKKVMALLAIAFCWAHKTGEWKHKAIRPLRTKKHGRIEQSLFRYGLDHLSDLILHGLSKTENLLKLWVLFICPPDIIGFDKQKPEIMVPKV
ncbi:IS4 family transposase (plasmid) [Methylomarinum sp. Ch1-1]|uniref:IS4 family transposase n=1 Tax=Methylomarinum roseum TaxID=3067653 RepID=A0AAU7NNV9_9GAMM|nr:IS4 family transposase [Methylomarinum sp. Ch1-1]MDP4523111.1 IS4 family transposase [Methylomarinum sp. Ch1-1]